MTIQKNIIQTCKSIDGLNSDFISNIEKIRKLNPDWNYKLFDDRAVHTFFKDFFGDRERKLLSRVNKNYGVVYADIFRYAYIYKHGGVYLDIKSTINNPLSSMLNPNSKYLVSQWRNRLGEEFSTVGLHPEILRVPGGEFQQWHVIAESGHPFLNAVLDQIFRNIENYDPMTLGVGQMGVLRLTGPICYTNTIYPIIRKHPCQIVDIQNLGFQYSIYRNTDDRSRHARGVDHYSRLAESIII